MPLCSIEHTQVYFVLRKQRLWAAIVQLDTLFSFLCTLGIIVLLFFLHVVFKELEFERGIWSAAMDGEEKKVEKLLKSGVCPSATDSSGYTALVYSYCSYLIPCMCCRHLVVHQN